MTGMQQLDQPGGTREYVPRHAWAEPAEAPAVQASAALLYEAQTTESSSSAAMDFASTVDPTRAIQPYQLVDNTTDYVNIEPERKRLFRGRKTA
jgi:hypothetical protein